MQEIHGGGRVTLSILEQLLEVQPCLSEWEHLTNAIAHSSHRPIYLDLPNYGCQAAGIFDEQACRVAQAALMCLYVSIVIIDDILDEELQGWHVELSSGEASNMAAVLQAAGCKLLLASAASPEAKLRALDAYNQTIVATGYGQYRDVSLSTNSEEAYWQIVTAKSVPFFSFAFQIGAILSGASLEVDDAIAFLGTLFGEMVQIQDDLRDTMEPTISPDWQKTVPPLPILFAEQVPHPEQAAFLKLRNNIEKPGNLHKAQQILIRCGAISYGFDQLMQRYAAALTFIESYDSLQKAPLYKAFRKLVEPVQELMVFVGIPHFVDDFEATLSFSG